MEVSSQTKKKINNLRLSAFTLAEVLITLGIIGMIANLTLPALFSSVGEKQAKVAWVKKYSEINQIIKRMNADYLIPFDTGTLLRDGFASYILSSKKCTMSVSEGCWHSKWYTLEGVQVVGPAFDNRGYILNDGSLLVFPGSSTPATKFSVVAGNVIPFFAVDVNGFKGPNKNGYDIFGGYVGAESIVFIGGSYCQRDNYVNTSWTCDMGCSENVILGKDY